MHLTRPARLSFASIPVLLLAASALRAQEPARTPAVPTAPSVSFDVAALAKDRFRGSIEAMSLGRFTVGLSGSYSHTVDQEYSVYAPYDYATMNRPMSYDPYYCAYPESFSCIGPYWNTPPRYRAWALDLAIRYYPSVLSFQNGPSRMMVYVGEFVGYHWRTWDEQGIYYYRYGPDDPMPLVSSDTVIPPYQDTLPVYPIWPGPNPIRRTLNAIQPGVEFGVRLLPFGRLFIDVGGRFTLVTIEDPMQRVLKGNVESRLVVAGGLVW